MLVKIETERMIGLSINYLHMIGYMYGELIVLWQIIAEIAAGRIIDCAELEQLKLNVFFFFWPMVVRHLAAGLHCRCRKFRFAANRIVSAHGMRNLPLFANEKAALLKAPHLHQLSGRSSQSRSSMRTMMVLMDVTASSSFRPQQSHRSETQSKAPGRR